MGKLTDLAPSTCVVMVRGQPVEVTGIDIIGVAHLIRRFQGLKDMVAERGATAEVLAELGPDVIAAVIAAGTGGPGSKNAEAVARKLPLGAQAELISAIMKETMPEGFGPFVERLKALEAMLPEAFITAPESQTPTRSEKSPAPSTT